MDKQLQKLIELSNKTGDRLIVFDPSRKEKAYVVMPVEDYENIAIGRSEVRGLTEDELLDKINRDIAIWQSDRIVPDDALKSAKIRREEQRYDDFDAEVAVDTDTDEEDDWYSIEEIAKNNSRVGKGKRKGVWRIPSERKENAEEIIEEDRYYLEDIED